MKQKKLFLAVLLVGLIVPAAARPQVCGDVNGSGVVSISDMTYIMAYLMGMEPSTLPSQADCDDRAGVTISDLDAIIQYLFHGALPSIMDCNIQSSYAFDQSLADTVFLPYMTGIPDDINYVALPIITSFAHDTRAFYLPTVNHETNGPGLFYLNSVVRPGEGVSLVEANWYNADTANIIGARLSADENVLSGRNNFFNLTFARTGSGVASINCSPTFRSAVLRVAVKKGDNLYVPVIQYYEVPLPHAEVTVAPSPLALTAAAGFWSQDSYQFTVTSNLMPVSFNLAVSDDWIVIQDPSSTGYTTPATISIKANASALPVGEYSGQITFTDIDPGDAEFLPSALDVTLSATEPITFPFGDLNCDGQVSIGDIVILIDCLFIDARPLEPCEN